MSDLPLPEPTPSADALDIQHDTDPEQDQGPARHIPHLGHAVLFFTMSFLCLALSVTTVFAALHLFTEEEIARHPLALFLSQCLSYVLALTASAFLFPVLWRRSFLRGISWTARAAKRFWWQLVLLGFLLSGIAQGCDYFIHSNDASDISILLHTRLSAWVLTLLAPTLAPLMEEVAFRGFLLPSLATAYDWLLLERTPAGIARWQQSTQKSQAALVFGAVISSIAFALIHSSQLHGAKGPVAVLFFTSLAFSAVYVRFRSVAASTLVHMAYNGLIFIELLVQSGGYRHLDKLL
jgi:uncharacterized protein